MTIISKALSPTFVAVALFVFSFVIKAQAAFEFNLSAQVIAPGERVIFTIKLPEKDLIKAPPKNPNEESDPPVLRDELLSQNSAIHILDQDVKKEDGTYVWRYELTVYEEGKIKIPPVQIAMGPQTFSNGGRNPRG